MAGAFDRDIDIPKATAPMAPDTYEDPIQKKTKLGAIQKEYIDTRSKTRVELDGIVKTLGQIKAQIDKDPVSTKYNLNGVVVSRKELLAYYNSASASTAEALKLQAIIDANDNANAGASDEAKKLLKSDAIFVAQGASGISNTGKYYLDGVEVSKETYAGGGSGPTGRSGGSGGTESNPLTNASGGGAVSNERRDAFAAITTTLKTYGFTDAEMLELEKYISNILINPSIGPNQALLDMRQLGAYKARFAGNETRVKAGLNALSESDYLQQEDSYGQYMKAYGVPDLGNRIQYASLIAGDVSATELNKRLDLAVTRVKKSDPEIFRQLQNYYGITETDMVKYVLKPTEMLPELQRKVTSAEIGAAFIGQGLTSNRMSSEGLADYGVDRAGALQGAASIAAVLPEATKLGNVYGETGIQYNQQTGEEEFLKSNDEAKRKRNILASKERASFEGGAGNAPGAYSTNYLKRNSSVGQI